MLHAVLWIWNDTAYYNYATSLGEGFLHLSGSDVAFDNTLVGLKPSVRGLHDFASNIL